MAGNSRNCGDLDKGGDDERAESGVQKIQHDVSRTLHGAVLHAPLHVYRQLSCHNLRDRVGL